MLIEAEEANLHAKDTTDECDTLKYVFGFDKSFEKTSDDIWWKRFSSQLFA